MRFCFESQEERGARSIYQPPFSKVQKTDSRLISIIFNRRSLFLKTRSPLAVPIADDKACLSSVLSYSTDKIHPLTSSEITKYRITLLHFSRAWLQNSKTVLFITNDAARTICNESGQQLHENQTSVHEVKFPSHFRPPASSQNEISHSYEILHWLPFKYNRYERIILSVASSCSVSESRDTSASGIRVVDFIGLSVL